MTIGAVIGDCACEVVATSAARAESTWGSRASGWHRANVRDCDGMTPRSPARRTALSTKAAITSITCSVCSFVTTIATEPAILAGCSIAPSSTEATRQS